MAFAKIATTRINEEKKGGLCPSTRNLPEKIECCAVLGRCGRLKGSLRSPYKQTYPNFREDRKRPLVSK